MSDKMDNEALHKFFNNLTSNRNYPPPHYPSMYPPMPNPMIHSPFAPQDYLNNDKSKMPSPYNDYYKNALYNPTYPPTTTHKTTFNPQPSQLPFSTASQQKPSKQSEGQAQIPSNSIYPMSMQPNTSYPYGFPYYYPGMPYPFGMYPSYYYNRPMNEMYSGQASSSSNYSMGPSMMPPPYFPPPPNFSAPQKNISPIVKEQIIISSDEQNDVKLARNEVYEKEAQYQVNKYQEYLQEKKEKEKREQLEMKQALARQQQQLKQANQDNQIPFEIRRRKKIEKEKHKIKKEQAEPKRQSLQHKKHKEEIKPSNNKAEQSREDSLKKIDVAEKERISGPLDSKQNISEQRNDSKKNSNNIELIAEKNDKKEQENQKKDRIKDDHPLKQLRYSESHGRIRIGPYYQSSVPALLCDNDVQLLRKKLQDKLKQRQVSAITF